jgi:hypothetical protein
LSTKPNEKEARARYFEAQTYRATISALPDEELRKRYDSLQAEIEAGRAFNLPSTDADFSYWAAASYWTLDEAVALSFGKNPRLVNWELIEPLIWQSPFALEFSNRRELVIRAEVMGQLWDQTAPSVFLAWAERMRFSMPTDLIEAVKSLGIQIRDWKTLYDRNVAMAQRLTEKLEQERTALVTFQATIEDEHRKAVEQQRSLADLTESAVKKIATIEEKDRSIAELSARITQLEGSSLSKAGDALGARERESLLKLVIGMAVKGYGHDPKANRSPTSKDIAGDLALVGLAMDEDTVRKYLAEAKQLLPGDETERDR